MNEETTRSIHRGDLFFCNLGDTKGSVQGGIRPVLIVQNNTGNRFSSTLIVAVLTSVIKKLSQPTHILIGKDFGLPEESMIMCEQLCTIDRCELLSYIGFIGDQTCIEKIDKALGISLGLIKAERKVIDQSIRCLCPKCKANYMLDADLIVRRLDPLQVEKEQCDFCQTKSGYDYIITKKGGS